MTVCCQASVERVLVQGVCVDLVSGVMPGVKVRVSMFAFIASTCHQCWSAGSSLGCGLNFLALLCGFF